MSFSSVTAVYWHAHEMVYGYALATVAGFLLTAVMNWTGLNTASGKSLAVLFVFWLLARVGFLFDWPIQLVALLDMGFVVGLLLLFAIPVIRSRQWKQVGLASKFILLVIANGVFYANALGWLENSAKASLVAGLFLVLAINLTMMRRLIPFFTEKAFGLPEKERTKWLDIIAIGGFFALMVCAVGFAEHWLTSLVALPLTLIHLVRLAKWYHPKIWRITLLWPLYLSYGFMIVGMFLYVFVGLSWLHESFAIHALAAGGIGLLCSAILARIALGHTHRNVFEPPKGLALVFLLLLATALIRVFAPLLMPESYLLWVQLSQWGWISAFALLGLLYWRVLLYPSPKPTTGILL